MTIDSSWLHAFKEDAPHAFSNKIPFRPRAIFVDGQIKLMQGFQREPLSWDQFIYRQFTRHLEKWFETSDTVVLAFDNYEHVPRAKSMTQAKRRKNVPSIPFSEHSELPPMVPEGDRWTQCIANRAFKTRVIDLVLLRLPQALLPPGEAHRTKRLIVDYQEPREFAFDPSEQRVTSHVLRGMPPLGEADVKFTRYADLYDSLMVDSIDGDSVPIALMHLERALRSTTPQRIPRIAIYRMELRLVKTERTAGVKRGSPTAEDGRAKRERRTYEFVHVNALHTLLLQAIAQSSGRVTVPTHAGHEMAMLVALIALTGTDFTRNLPQLGGKTLFSWLPDIWGVLAASFDPVRDQLSVEPAVDLLVTRLYASKFPRHLATNSCDTLDDTLAQLRRAPKMGQRLRDSLPSADRVRCTVRNVNWLLKYWGCTADHPVPPDPVQPEYGFVRLPNGATEYADLASGSR